MIPFVMINLDKPRRLRFGMSAMLEFEQLTGLKLMELSVTPETYAKVLWVMLKQDDPDITLKQTAELVDDYAESVVDVIQIVDGLMDSVFPKVKDPNAKAPAAQ